MFYTIQGNDILIANNKEALSKYYSDVLPLPVDYEAGKYIVKNGVLIDNTEAWEIEQKRIELEKIQQLKLTKREVFLGLYQAKGITPEQIKETITDKNALIEFEYANDYYRGNPLVDTIGNKLGLSTHQLDEFFKTKDPKTLQ